MTAWTVEGVLRCPGDCGLYFDFNGTAGEIKQFTDAHDCAEELTPAASAWISGECADGVCGMCPGAPLTDDLPPCSHPCHDDQTRD